MGFLNTKDKIRFVDIPENEIPELEKEKYVENKIFLDLKEYKINGKSLYQYIIEYSNTTNHKRKKEINTFLKENKSISNIDKLLLEIENHFKISII